MPDALPDLPTPEQVREYMRLIGRKGGKTRTPKRLEHCREMRRAKARKAVERAMAQYREPAPDGTPTENPPPAQEERQPQQ